MKKKPLNQNKTFTSWDCYGEYYITTTKLDGINFDSLARAFYRLNDKNTLDEYTEKCMKDFFLTGFTKYRVDAAQKISDSDCMAHYSYDEEGSRPCGLSICFNGKFYSIGYKEGRMSESELYNIYTHKKILK